MGVVPRENSTGKQKLLSIGKRDNCYLRRLFVQRARAVSSGLGATGYVTLINCIRSNSNIYALPYE